MWKQLTGTQRIKKTYKVTFLGDFFSETGIYEASERQVQIQNAET